MLDTVTNENKAGYATAGHKEFKLSYDPFAPHQIQVQCGLDDDQTIKLRSREDYVEIFKRTEARTARATLQMCRVVYEAKQTLEEHEFADFCAAIGYKDFSSSICKFCAIGKLQPRLVKHASLMPHEWSKIYMVTQIPAKMFEHFVEKQKDFRGRSRTQTSKTGFVKSSKRYCPSSLRIWELYMLQSCLGCRFVISICG